MPPGFDIALLTPDAPDWPTQVDSLARPPCALHVRGAMPGLARAVAIVGTRRPSVEAERFTHTLAGELADAGCVVVSGGALGVDAAAHLGALEAGGHTVAVLATGLVRPYPARHAQLFVRIAAQGALVAEERDLRPVFKSAFLERNRLIAALAAVTVVVQAPLASGALSTAAHARKLGRPLLAVPHGPWQRDVAGGLALLEQGVRPCRGSADVLALLAKDGARAPRADPRAAAPRAPAPTRVATLPAGLDDDERAVFEALGDGALCADDLCERAGLSAPRVQRALLMLLLGKLIDEVGSGRYARAARPVGRG